MHIHLPFPFPQCFTRRDRSRSSSSAAQRDVARIFCTQGEWPFCDPLCEASYFKHKVLLRSEGLVFYLPWLSRTCHTSGIYERKEKRRISRSLSSLAPGVPHGVAHVSFRLCPISVQGGGFCLNHNSSVFEYLLGASLSFMFHMYKLRTP